MGAAQGRIDAAILALVGQIADSRMLGSTLFDALFHGSLYARYISVHDHARLTQQERHSRLEGRSH